MCGIAGFSLSDADLAEVNPASLAKRLALSIEHRGRDATGLAFRPGLADTNPILYNKAPVTATKFVTSNGHRVIDREAHSVQIHTRAWTTGSPSDNNNNHPIPIDPYGDYPAIVGTHNGCIYNDGFMWKKYPELNARRRGEVDSEVIFSVMQSYGLKGLEDIDGDASIAWVSLDNPDRLHIARLGGRPLSIAMTENGSVLYASETSCLEDIFKLFRQLTPYEAPIALADGEHLAMERGVIEEYDKDYPVIGGWGRPYYSTPSKPKNGTTVNTGGGWQGHWDGDDHWNVKAPTPLPPAPPTPKPSSFDRVDALVVEELCPWWEPAPDSGRDPKDVELMMELIYAHCDPGLVESIANDVIDALAKEEKRELGWDETLEGEDLDEMIDEILARDDARDEIQQLALQIGEDPNDPQLTGMGDWEGVKNNADIDA